MSFSDVISEVQNLHWGYFCSKLYIDFSLGCAVLIVIRLHHKSELPNTIIQGWIFVHENWGENFTFSSKDTKGTVICASSYYGKLPKTLLVASKHR